MSPASIVAYDIEPMLDAAGGPEWRALRGAPASDAGRVAASIAAELRRDPDKYRAMDPPSGITYDVALAFLDSFAEACSRHPNATVRGSL